MPSPIQLTPIGTIRTPYTDDGFCPHQPVEREEGVARVELDPAWGAGLRELDSFRYVYLLYHLDRARPGEVSMEVTPDWTRGHRTGLFATRSPDRPCPIGLSVVRLKRIEGNTLVTGLIDVFDNTPLLDVKPYIRELDSKEDANFGWIEGLDGYAHLMDHVRGIPHRHDHGHDHDHSHHDH